MRAASVLSGIALCVAGMVATALPLPSLAQGNRPVTCGSVNGRLATCPVDWRDARLVHQDSDTRCVRGQNWGVRRGAIWVDKGCRGQFVAAGRGHGGGQPGWDRDIRLQCGSVNNRYRLCQVDLGPRGRVQLVHQESDASCRQGYSWGYNRAGVWVDHGCRGQFVVNRRR